MGAGDAGKALPVQGKAQGKGKGKAEKGIGTVRDEKVAKRGSKGRKEGDG